ncbi:uncharacterized protein LOC119689205 [Teleopsis dalmanni]|uniref:uncharacterized protein LOC119689205 n=1 Tax=Teleopsis dalmanni TaxID=139649 RepID=UPI0018CD9421|nr:uncharacterized protein LOC119689205 [Teleopsis dalmanni]
MDTHVNGSDPNINNGSHMKANKLLASRQAFGELKNVIHLQTSQLKSNMESDSDQDKSGDGKKNVEKPEFKTPAVHEIEAAISENCEDINSNEFDENFIDSFDFSKFNCCELSDEQVWSEMGALDDSFINKLLEGVKNNLVSDNDEFEPEANFEDFIDLYSNALMPVLSVAGSDQESDEDFRLRFDIPDLSSSDDELPPEVTIV